MMASKLFILLVTISLVSLVLYFRKQWYSIKRTSTFVTRWALAFLELQEFLTLLDRSTGKSHFLDRHGPVLNQEEIRGRAMTGEISFSGVKGKPVASARWLMHADLLKAVNSALEQWSNGVRPKSGSFNFEFDHPIGEGYLKEGSLLHTTRVAKVVIKDGEIITAFPVLEPINFSQQTYFSASDVPPNKASQVT